MTTAGTRPAQWRAAGRQFTHRGHAIFYRDQGEGEALLCLHGFPTSSWDWHRIWPELTARFRVVAPDMIGFGFSAKPHPYPYGIHDQADLHESLLEHLGLDRVHLLAHDYGDTVAQELLARHEERRRTGPASPVIDSVCLLNGGLFPETHRARRIQKLLASPLGPLLVPLMGKAGLSRGLAGVFGASTQPTPEELDQFWEIVSRDRGTRVLPALLGYIRERRRYRERWVRPLRETDVPLRLIDGLDDPVSGGHLVRRYRELIPEPDVVELAGIGHYPQMEDPESVLAGFFSFQDRLARSRQDAGQKASARAQRP